MKAKQALSNRQQQEYKVNVNRLMAAGVIPRSDNTPSEPQMLTLEQAGGPMDSFVHALPFGGYGMGVWVRIVVMKSGVSLSDCHVRPRKWGDTRIRLVDGTNGFYSYARDVGVEYPRANILNPWISSNRYLSRGKVLEGVVMAHSPVPLPAWCGHGVWIEADFCFVDQFDNLYPLTVDLRVMRDTHRKERLNRTGLFGPKVASRQRTYREEEVATGTQERISPKEPSVRATDEGVH